MFIDWNCFWGERCGPRASCFCVPFKLYFSLSCKLQTLYIEIDINYMYYVIVCNTNKTWPCSNITLISYLFYFISWGKVKIKCTSIHIKSFLEAMRLGKGGGATTPSQINIFKKKEKWNQVNYTSTVSVEFQDRSEYHST